MEERIIDSKDYSNETPSETHIASRHLPQAMVPGNHLVSVRTDSATYASKIESIWNEAS